MAFCVPGKLTQGVMLSGNLWHFACQATDSELRLAHSEEHIAYIETSGPEDWACGDNFFSEATPVAARTATGCTVQVRAAYSQHLIHKAVAVVYEWFLAEAALVPHL